MAGFTTQRENIANDLFESFSSDTALHNMIRPQWLKNIALAFIVLVAYLGSQLALMLDYLYSRRCWHGNLVLEKKKITSGKLK